MIGNLEEEYGWFLDGVERYITENPEEFLTHHGVKGMKWGVRKDQPPGNELTGLGPDKIVRKTASGETLTLLKDPPTAIHKTLAKLSKNYRKAYSEGAHLTIRNEAGKKVGEANVWKKNDDDLYLNWLGIDASERGKGYATAVMKSAQEFGSVQGFKRMTLEVPGNSPDARHIYEKLGFKVIKDLGDDPVWGSLTEMEYRFDVEHQISHQRQLELVVVALPDEVDSVRKYSSEKEPHLTLLYLGAPDFTPEELAQVIGHIEHASSKLSPFILDIEHRGELGDKRADVLFFNKSWAKGVSEFRSHLLKNDLINKAYHSTDQFPEWAPHLTMGYPETPAKDAQYNRNLSMVGFDRIALWTSDSSGPTYQLKPNNAVEVDMAQANINSTVNHILVHYGIKGMKWGVRRSDSELNSSRNSPDSDDVVSVKAKKKQVKKNRGKTDSLSNKELKELVERMNLEQQYARLKSEQNTIGKGQSKAKQILGATKTIGDIAAIANGPIAKALVKTLAS